MESPQSNIKTYPKKPGTTQSGDDYEVILAAFLAFKLVNDNHVEDFYLSSNNNQFGSFDDIVVEFIENQKVSRIHAIQLKHRENNTKTVTRDQLAATKGDFSLQKYFECFKDIKKKYKHANLNCYLFTNAKFEHSREYTIRLKNKEHIEVSACQSLLSENDLFNTSDNKFVFQFKIIQNDEDDPEIAEYTGFLDHFFLYSNQKNLAKMESFAWDLFQKEYFCDISSFENYMKFISKWHKLDVENYCLNKEIVSLKIGECLLRPVAMNVSLSSGNNSKFRMLQHVFLHFDTTILQTDEEFIKRNITEIFRQISNINVEEASKTATNFFIERRKNVYFNEFDEYKKITVLWYMNKLPLILQVDGNKNILKHAEKFCQRRKFIFIGQHIDRSDCQSFKIFQNLQDLPNDSSVYKKIVQDTKISLQGRRETPLEDLIRNFEEIKEAFTPLELMNTTDGYLRVGEDKEELPHPYITQFLPKYVIDFKFLQENHTESLSVINAKQRLDNIKEKISGVKLVALEEYLGEAQVSKEVEESIRSLPKISKSFDKNEPFVLVAEDQCSLEEFRRICDKSPNKPCHLFCINSDNSMEWIRSNGDIEDLKKYKSVSNYISETEIFSSSNSKINLITGRPGMGKTVLLKYLKNNIPSNYWVVNISLREHFQFFKKEHSNSEILNYLLEDQAKKMKYNNFTIRIRNIFQSKRSIVFLWDGLDELPNNYLNEVLKAIEHLSNLGFINWITAREHLQPMLEAKFKVFALNIKEIDPIYQKSYIKKRLEAKYSEVNLEELTQKIMEAVATTEGVSFLGIPFHINILTELFVYDAEKYNNMLSNLTLADMIDHSVEEKFNFYYREKCKYEDTNFAIGRIFEEFKENRIFQYELVALKTFLSTEDIVDKLDINSQQLLTKIQLSKDDLGMIVGVNEDDRAIFVHNIYGEYFVASWMAKNLQLVQNFKQFFFQYAYNNIRLIFDIILAKNCPAHLAVLHHNFSSLRKNTNEIKQKDKAGRNPLHLACSWGEKRPVLPVEEEEDLLLIDDSDAKDTKEDSFQYKKILNFLINRRKCDPFEKDNLFQWDCVEYATNSLCLYAVEVLSSNPNLERTSLQKFNDCNIWYYGIRFGYMNLLQMVETVPYVELRRNRMNLLHEAVDYGRNECLKKIFTNSIYLKHINKDYTHRQFILTTPYIGIPISLQPVLGRGGEFEHIKGDYGYNVYKILKQAPLHIAASNGNLEAIQILLEKGADIHIVTNGKESALCLATMYQHLDVVKLLMKNGASINRNNSTGENILHIAAQTGNCELIVYLLKQNVPFTCTKNNVSPLHYVVLYNHMDALRIIFKRMKLLPKHERTCLVFGSCLVAIELGRTDIVKYFVRNGLDVNATSLNVDSTPLHKAAFFGHLDIASYLIENKANINVRDKISNATPLHYAVLNGHIEIVQMLIQKVVDLSKTDKQGNSNINLCDRFGRTPLYIAVLKNELRITEMLLEAGADCNQTDDHGTSVLLVSMVQKHKEMFEFLLMNCKKYGLNLDLAASNGGNALYFAVQKGDEHATRLLLENGASTTILRNSRNIVHLAARVGNVEVLNLLMKHDADINLHDQEMYTPLYIAVLNNQLRITEMLLEAGSDCNQTNCHGTSILLVSLVKKHQEIFEFLLKNCKKYGLNLDLVDSQGGNALYFAVQEGNEQATRLLLENGASTTVQFHNGINIVHLAAKVGNVEILNLLMKHGADINLPDQDMFTPLHIAVLNNQLRTTEILLEAGTDCNQTNDYGSSTLLMSMIKRHKEIFEFLLKNCKKYGLNLDLVNSKGVNPLYIAVHEGDEHATRLLLENGASTMVQYHSSRNIVHLAAQVGKVEILKLLMKHGANINLSDEEMATPLHFAAHFGRIECARMLLENGADPCAEHSSGVTPRRFAEMNGHHDLCQLIDSFLGQ